MKIERLIGIITTLQQHKTVTAPYLAKKFEVSRRTIQRDIDDICKAGIPIVTSQGSGGGIAIMEGFSIDTTLFTREELTAIFTGLKTLDSVSNSETAKKLAQKFGGDNAVTLTDGMMIDLSSFYKDDLAGKIEILKNCIKESLCVSFRYYYNKGESDITLEPYLVVFKWSSWYVFGYSQSRQDFRMYKLRRLWDLKILDQKFILREVPEEKKEFGRGMTDDYIITALYDKSVKYRLIEEYGPYSFTETEDGKLLTNWGFTDKQFAVQWFLSFGNKVTVLAPDEMVERMKDAVNSIQKLYQT